jgi:hypothetical protein
LEKSGLPAVSLITTAFEAAARARARILGCERHPQVVMQHPLASKTMPEVAAIAEQLIEQIAKGLVKAT